MHLNGEFNIAGPGLEKKEVRIIGDAGNEFLFNLIPGKKVGIQKFSIWATLDKDKDVKIETGLDDDMVHDYLFFEFMAMDGNSFGLAISCEQAKALNEILNAYVRSYEAFEEAKKKGEIIIGKYTEPVEEKVA